MQLARKQFHNEALVPTPQDIVGLNAIAARQCGIVLGDDKAEFLRSRLSKYIAERGFGSFAEYRQYLERSTDDADRRQFIEMITTHTTNFFREEGHYTWLKEEGFRLLWEQGAGRSNDLVVWSAACSTGQELYSAMMTAQATAQDDMRTMRFAGVGTDIARPVLKQAKDAVYSHDEIQGIPQDYRRTCLLSAKTGIPRYRIVPELRAKTEWKRGNLSDANDFDGLKADVAFIRNVLIYFEPDVQRSVIRTILSRLRPGGFLITGHAEAGAVRDEKLTTIRPSIYRKDA